MRITYMGKQVRENNGRFSSFRKQVAVFFRKLFRLSILSLAIYSAFLVGRYIAPTETVTNVVQADNGISPVMQRIMDCESGQKLPNGKAKPNTARHYDKNGQILMRSNTNRSVDVGIAQINTVWFAKATELGLDITKEEDNKKMAEWIYSNRGTGDWYSSQNCWR